MRHVFVGLGQCLEQTVVGEHGDFVKLGVDSGALASIAGDSWSLVASSAGDCPNRRHFRVVGFLNGWQSDWLWLGWNVGAPDRRQCLLHLAHYVRCLLGGSGGPADL